MENFIICVECEQTLLELEEGDDPTKNWVCNECYMKMIEPDYAAGEGYHQ